MKLRNAIICASGLLAVASILYGQRIRGQIEKLGPPTVPPLSPELQAWAEYVEKYPNLEDDPKIKNAIDLLNKYPD